MTDVQDDRDFSQGFQLWLLEDYAIETRLGNCDLDVARDRLVTRLARALMSVPKVWSI